MTNGPPIVGNQVEHSYPWTTCAVLTLATLLGAFLRLYRLGYAELDMDELYTSMFVLAGPKALLGDGYQVETNPPLYYLIQWCWLIFGSDRFALRSLPATLGILTIPLLYLTSRRLVGERAALISAVLLATAPLPLYYSRYLRCYSLLMFASMASVACFVRLLPADLFRRGSEDIIEGREPGQVSRVLLWLGYLVATLVCLYSHNTMVLLPFLYAVVVGLLVVGGRRVGWGFVAGWVISTGLAVLAYSPWFLVSVRQAHEVLQDFWIPRPTLSRGGLYYIYSQMVGTYPYRAIAKPLAYSLPLIGLWRLRRSPWSITLIVVFLVGLPLLTTLIAFYRPILIVRVLFWPSFFFFILMGSALAWPRQAWISALGTLAIVGLHGLQFAREIPRHRETPDSVEITRVFRDRLKSTDAVLFSPVRILPNAIDYEGRNDHPPTVDRFYVTPNDVRIKLDVWMRARFLTQAEASDRLKSYPRVWFLTEARPRYPMPPFAPIEPIMAGLGPEFREAGHWRLIHNDVWLYERVR